MDDLLREFVEEAGEHLAAAAREAGKLERGPDPDIALRLFHRLHSLKGTAAFLPLPRLAALAHLAETGLEGPRTLPDPGRVAVITATIDRMRAILDAVRRHGAEPDGDDADLAARLATAEGPDRAGEAPCSDEFEHLIALIDKMSRARERLRGAIGLSSVAHPSLDLLAALSGECERQVLAASPEPVSKAWARLPCLVQSLEAGLSKPLDLVTEGAEMPVPAGVVAVLRDALPHLVRNAADHGIETGPARLALGKPERGRIKVAAALDGGTVIVTVEDDGAGLDREAIGRAALCPGPPPDPAEAARLVFRPGLTTAARVSPVSGRGIGLDAVRALIEGVGGTVEIRSEPGRGTLCTLRLPARPLSQPARLRAPSHVRSVRP